MTGHSAAKKVILIFFSSTGGVVSNDGVQIEKPKLL